MDTDDLIPNASAEARLVKVHRSTVSRAREDPTHPVNQPDAIRAGDTVIIKSADALAWWKKRWDNASADDLARKRRRPVPDQGAKA